MKVTLFKKITQTSNGTHLFIEEVLNGIKSGKWQDLCLPIMNEKDKEKRQKLKTQVPYFTACGTFENRRNDSMVEASGLIAIDFDEVDNINTLIALVNADQYTFATFKSISHKGFCTLVKIEPSKHKEAFEGLSNYYYQLLKIPSDPACKDVSRPRYVSFDPDAFMNSASKIFKEYPKKETKQQNYERTKVDYIHTDDKFDRVLKAINIDITGDYLQWRNIGFAIASKYGPAGEDYFHHVSSFSPKYDRNACSRQYKFCCKSGNITISTFYYYAKQAGINISSKEEQHIAKITHYAKTSGRNKESVKEILNLQNIQAPDDIINAVFESENFTPTIDSKDSKLNIDDVELWLQTNYKIKRNTITRFYENDGAELQTEDLNSIYISAKKTFDKLSRDIFDTIIFSNFTPSYNPIKDYFESLKWDKVERIQDLCKTITSDTGDFGYRHILLQSWLLGIIESVYTNEPNILHLILAGKKNTGKSAFFKRLLPKKIENYLAFSQLDKGKDDELLMCQKLLILDDEGSGKSKVDAKIIKRMLSAPYFDLREPYGKKNVTLRRIATLCSTSNETELLNDPTGNRRNIIFEITDKFDYKGYNELDKEQLFAQLVDMHKNGFRSELSDLMIDLIEKYTNDKHSEASIEAETIYMLFEKSDNVPDFYFYTATQIKDIIEKNTVQKLSIKKLGMELKRLGYLRKMNKSGVYGYRIMLKNEG